MFKKIVHYFTSKSLEKHRFRTQCMIEEYERVAAESQTRIKAQSDKYARELESLSKQRENDLKEYIQFLNEHLTNTTEHVSQLKLLQQMMFVCLEDWMSMSQSEQRLSLQRSKYHLVISNIKLLESFEKEIVRLSQQEDRQAWREIISDRAPRVSTPKIDQHIKRFELEMDKDAKAYKQELRRINSHKKLLLKQLSDIHALRTKIREEEVKPAQKKFKQSKQDLRVFYNSCLQNWIELQNFFENYYQNKVSDSDLANQWISEMENGGTLKEYKQIISDTSSNWQDAKDYTSSLRERMASVKARISLAHGLQDFSTIDVDKKTRDSLFHSIKSAIEDQNRLYEARQVFYTRREEINVFLGWIKRFHPSKTVEQAFELVAQDSPDLYWKAIGLSTQTNRLPTESQQ